MAMLAMTACSEAGDRSTSGDAAMADAAMADVATAEASVGATAPPADGEMAAIGERPGIPVSLPKMAYVFDYGFRLPGQDIAPLQQKHADMCEAMGPYSCQIVSLSTSGDEGEYASGKLELAVVADKARAFGTRLAQAAEGAGGEQVSATIAGEDLSRQIVDTEARLRTRIVLRDRLLEVLRTRTGKVSELVEAERGVAQVNEEIDQARSWLEEMRGRVAFSRLNVNYESTTPAAGGFLEPIRGAIGSLGSILGTIIAALILLAAIAGPLALLGWGAVRLRRRFVPA
jgi:hypothetical protein